MDLPALTELGIADYAIVAAALGVFLIYFLLSLVRGTIRLLLVAIATFGGGASAWAALHFLPDFGGGLLSRGPGWLFPTVIALIGGTAFLFLRGLLFLIFRPLTLDSQSDPEKRFSFIRSGISLICGLAVAWAAGVGLRYIGTYSELQLAHEQAQQKKVSANSMLWKWADWKQRFDASEIGKWHLSTDPLADPERAKVAAILLRLNSPDSLSPQLEQLTNHPQWVEFLAQLETTEIARFIEENNYAALLASPQLKKIAPELLTDTAPKNEPQAPKPPSENQATQTPQ